MGLFATNGGGFGGGGGAGLNGGGGGGGYLSSSGGGGGGGGGSYLGAGLLNTLATVSNTGDGYVSITLSPAIASAPEPSTFLLAAMGGLGLMAYARWRPKSAAA